MAGVKWGFNLYFAAGLILLLGGCATSKDPNDKLTTMLRGHLEALPRGVVPTSEIVVYRAHPVTLKIENLHVLTEDNIIGARVVEQMGTYAIEIKIDQWAVPLIEHSSSSHQGRRLAIQAQWGPKQENYRWLAAPKMTRRITDGTFTFTPDATLEECYQIVTGLNNKARKSKKAWD